MTGSDDQRRVESSAANREPRWRRLPRDDRLICVWRSVGFSDAEIATHLGKTVSAVQAALRRAREHMR
jgi:DNA-directed RNA polymerase specialized sigma24 family protein